MKLLQPKILIKFIFLSIFYTISAQGQIFYVSVNALNFRSCESTICRIKEVLKKNERVNVISTNGEWAEVKYKKTQGFVKLKYLSKTKSLTNTTERFQTAKITSYTNGERRSDFTKSNNSASNEEEVLLCYGTTAYAYHSRHCQGLNRCRGSIKKVSKQDAIRENRTPCGYCY